MSDVQITAGLRRKSSNDLSFFGILQPESKPGSGFVCTGFCGFGLGKVGQSSLG